MGATATGVVGATRSSAREACWRSSGVESRKMRAKRERMEGLERRAAQEVGRRAKVVWVWVWERREERTRSKRWRRRSWREGVDWEGREKRAERL